MNALIIGQGSIGQRHAKILAQCGATVSTLSRHAEGSFRDIDEALGGRQFSYIVVANETSKHVETMRKLAHHAFDGTVLVEKPLSVDAKGLVVPCNFKRVGVAYNLRFHPVVASLKDALAGKKPVEVRIHAGQYLPDWRPGSDFRGQSSAKLSSGGGVLRDLSHEIDLLHYLFGPWTRLVSTGGNKHVLGIETDEIWSVLLELRSGATVLLSLNYLDRNAERRITVNTPEDTVCADLIAGTLISRGATQTFAVERDHTYRAQHRAMHDPNDSTVCTLSDAVEVMKTIAAIEQSAREERWVVQ